MISMPSGEAIVLRSCTLAPLEADAAGEIGRVLASMDPWRRLGYRAEQLFSYLVRDDPALKRYAVLVDGANAGVVCMRFPWLLGPYNELLAVYGECQGKGVGREVMGWMEESHRPQARNLWTTVSSFNARARRFYESLGFSETAVLNDLVARGCDEVLLRKQLAAPPAGEDL